MTSERDELDSAIGELLGETHTINRDKTVAVSTTQFWEPIDTCPRGVKVQLLGQGGVAVYGLYYGADFWTHWAPLPKRRDE